ELPGMPQDHADAGTGARGAGAARRALPRVRVPARPPDGQVRTLRGLLDVSRVQVHPEEAAHLHGPALPEVRRGPLQGLQVQGRARRADRADRQAWQVLWLQPLPELPPHPEQRPTRALAGGLARGPRGGIGALIEASPIDPVEPPRPGLFLVVEGLDGAGKT